MRLSQYIDRQPSKRRKSHASPLAGFGAVAAHRAFVPMLCIWGAALLGLAIIVLPADMISRVNMLTGLGSLGSIAKFVYAAVAALVGGAVAFVIAKGIHSRATASDDSNSIVSAVNRRVRPINPATDLGSDSLDAPVDAMPFLPADEEQDTVEHDEAFDEELTTDEVALEECEAAEDGRAEPVQPTLGELSKRGYEFEAPAECQPAADNAEAEVSFTRKHFEAALLETCEGATCEAAETNTPERGDDAKQDQDDEEREGGGEDMPQVMAKAQPSGTARPIGRPGAGGSWSLTQFDPKPKTAPFEAAEKGVSKPTAAPIAPVASLVPDQERAPVAEPQPAPAPSLAEESKPVALDLGEFAELPGRDAVWVEEDAAEENADHGASVANDRVQTPPASALEKLRQRNPEELSLVEMVERFAGALHEHQQAEHSRLPKAGPSRDAALAEALKALTLFTERGFDRPEQKDRAELDSEIGKTERDLRDALLKLQNLRGAA